LSKNFSSPEPAASKTPVSPSLFSVAGASGHFGKKVLASNTSDFVAGQQTEELSYSA
jgi:hypothetical protein